ncbi:hypothetical protein TNCT_337641 [Trichonephila clavata]|uniref:Uncharacterized protein n=1 Tax=Trichonephila clavata TaxID=2740835 RepID=A0A8X6EYU8_TRICU|nr:hypothetical protein TNCT_337641 [Trichonephila clavata]
MLQTKPSKNKKNRPNLATNGRRAKEQPPPPTLSGRFDIKIEKYAPHPLSIAQRFPLPTLSERKLSFEEAQFVPHSRFVNQAQVPHRMLGSNKSPLVWVLVLLLLVCQLLVETQGLDCERHCRVHRVSIGSCRCRPELFVKKSYPRSVSI